MLAAGRSGGPQSPERSVAGRKRNQFLWLGHTMQLAEVLSSLSWDARPMAQTLVHAHERKFKNCFEFRLGFRSEVT